MPRIMTAIAVGFALALAGCIMQNVLRNPLASASTLGVSQGASFGAAFAIICLGAGSQVNSNMSGSAVSITNPYVVTICAFAGGIITTLVILGMARLRRSSPSSMILAGVALSSLFTGGTALIQYFADDVMVASVVYWTFGDLGRAGWNEILFMFILNLGCLMFFMYNRWNYNAIESGVETAKSLGVPVDGLTFRQHVPGGSYIRRISGNGGLHKLYRTYRPPHRAEICGQRPPVPDTVFRPCRVCCAACG